MTHAKALLSGTLLALSAQTFAQPPRPSTQADALSAAGEEAQRRLQQTFTNLKFEDFEAAPVKGAIYQAMAGGRLVYFAPESEHLIFASVFDRNGENLTALAESAATRRKLERIDVGQALTIGPEGAPEVVEFTDPDCPHCRSLDRFWAAKAAEGKPVRRRIFFVTGLHADAAGKAEHILCSADKAAAFEAIYAGSVPARLETCAEGRSKLRADTELVAQVGIAGTPTLIAGGQVISGFRQGEIEAFLDAPAAREQAKAATDARR